MKAIRRHNVRQVQFRPEESLHDYKDAPTVDYSTEEEEEKEEGEGEYAQDEEDGAEQQEVPASDQDDIAPIEPLKAGPRSTDTTNGSQGQNRQGANNTEPYSGVEKARTSDEMFESQGKISPLLRLGALRTNWLRRRDFKHIEEGHSPQYGLFLQRRQH